MADVHRDGDLRACGATTVVTGQAFVYVDGKLWAVDGDQDDHGGGSLEPTIVHAIYINDKKVCVVGDPAAPDSLCSSLHGDHCSPTAVTGDTNIGAT